MKYLGNLTEDQIIDFKFSTHKADGTPITLANGAVKVYKGNATDTEINTGVTLSVDFDGVTGLHNVNIDTSAAAFYAVANDYSVVITAGTVDSVSVVGTVLATFSIENRLNVLDELTAGHTVAGSAGKALTDILADTGTDGVVVATASKTGYGLSAAALDAILVESGITPSAALTDDAGNQLTSINARQALAAMLSALAAVLAGAATTTVTTKQAAKPAGNTRISATVDADGNRSAITLKVPT